MRRSLLLPILAISLLAFGCGPKPVAEQATDRMAIASALNRAALGEFRIQKKWPASLDAMKDSPELKKLPGGSLDGVKFDFKEIKDGSAVYRLTLQGKTREVKIGVPVESKGTPTLSGSASSG